MQFNDAAHLHAKGFSTLPLLRVLTSAQAGVGELSDGHAAVIALQPQADDVPADDQAPAESPDVSATEAKASP